MHRFLVVIAAVFSGLIFGFGVIVSGMVNPAKVLSFFDVAGAWDPSLALVMASALAVTVVGFRVLHNNYKPVFAPDYFLPTAMDIDSRLVVGAGLFGLGWGLAGFCPGPALAALVYGGQSVATFVLAMLTGIVAAKFITRTNRKTITT
ncbi:MAG: DUF6691 family protein [Hyphomicrobiaceae bacterium]